MQPMITHLPSKISQEGISRNKDSTLHSELKVRSSLFLD